MWRRQEALGSMYWKRELGGESKTEVVQERGGCERLIFNGFSQVTERDF